MEKEQKIVITWEEQEPDSAERVGAMYCFKICDINVN